MPDLPPTGSALDAQIKAPPSQADLLRMAWGNWTCWSVITAFAAMVFAVSLVTPS